MKKKLNPTVVPVVGGAVKSVRMQVRKQMDIRRGCYCHV